MDIIKNSKLIPVLDHYRGANTLSTSGLEVIESPTSPRLIGKSGSSHVPIFAVPNKPTNPNIMVFRAFFPVKKPNTDILLPPHLIPYERLILTACEDHYGNKSYSSSDYIFIDLMQGLLNRGEELNKDIGLHADIRLIDSKGTLLEEDIYFASSTLDTTFYDLPEKKFKDEELQRLLSHASSEFSGTPPKRFLPFQKSISANFNERVNSLCLEPLNFGPHTLVNLSASTPHRAQLAKEDETLRTFIAIRFTSRPYKNGIIQNPALDSVSTSASQEVFRRHAGL